MSLIRRNTPSKKSVYINIKRRAEFDVAHRAMQFITGMCFMQAAACVLALDASVIKVMSISELMKVEITTITTAGKKSQEIRDIPASVVVITRRRTFSCGVSFAWKTPIRDFLRQ